MVALEVGTVLVLITKYKGADIMYKTNGYNVKCKEFSVLCV